MVHYTLVRPPMPSSSSTSHSCVAQSLGSNMGVVFHWLQNQEAATEADRKFAQAGYRLNVRARLLLIRSYVALNTVLNRTLLATLYVFGQPVAMY